MSRFARRCAVILSLVGPAFAPVVRGQSTIRLGSEFQVNTYTPNNQTSPAVSLDGDGDFVVTWQGDFSDGSFSGVFARRFNAAGSPQATEFQVNTYTPGYQSFPAVAMDNDGDFVLAWQSSYKDGSVLGVVARRFDAFGSPQAVEFHVNTYSLGAQKYPAVAMDGDGDFVVTWQSDGQDSGGYDGVFARRFNAAGIPQAAEFQVNAYTPGNQNYPAVALDGDGDFVIVWQSYGQDGDSGGVFARRFNAAGLPQATEFQVNAHTTDSQAFSAVAIDDGGDFVAAWASYDQDGSNYGIFARRFDAAGSPQAEVQVNNYTPGIQFLTDVAIDDGDFIVTWTSYGSDGSFHGVFARHFDASGSPRAAEFQVNTYTPSSQFLPAVAIDDAGDFVVAWASLEQDGSGNGGVFAQRFATLAILDIDGDGETAPLTDGLLVLRFLFGFTGATLVSGAVDSVACSRCNALAIEGYLQTLI